MPHKPVVAIIDDDDAFREALSDLLMVAGLACSPFNGAAAFLAEYKQVSFDCLITDLRMPGISGLELLGQLHDLGSKLPVIVLTSIHEQKTRERALELGARTWLTKPVSDDRLLREINLALVAQPPGNPEGPQE